MTATKKIGVLKKIFFYVVSFFWGWSISINLPYALAWNTVVMSGLVLLAATWKCSMSYKNRYIGYVGPSLAASLKPHPQNVASLSLFYSYFGR